MKLLQRRMSLKRRNISEKEKLFCYMYVVYGNAKEAAVRAGYKRNPERTGARLLSARYVCKEIDRLKNTLSEMGATAGLNRLAYGSVNDAVKLLREDTINSSDIDALDLYSIAEIKKPKEGCIEIKFFDRLKALEKLYLINEAKQADEHDSFYRALENSVSSLPSSEETA